jgi:hypothetical protein
MARSTEKLDSLDKTDTATTVATDTIELNETDSSFSKLVLDKQREI